MGSIVASALYQLAGQFLIFFVLIPCGLILLGYLLFILAGAIQQYRKTKKK